MPRPPKGRVGRSAGVAEHRFARHRSGIRLSRTTSFTHVSALACVIALAIAGAPSVAAAQAPPPSPAQTRAAIDATANLWFAAQSRANSLDLQIQTLTQTLAEAGRRVARVRRVADARVVELYESGTQALVGVLGGSALELGRRAQLIGSANADRQLAIDEFEAAISDLEVRRGELGVARKAQARTLHDLAQRRRTLDTQLVSLQFQSARAQRRAALAAAIRHATPTPTPTATTAAEPTRSAALDVTAPLPPSAPAEVATSPVAPVETGSVSSHHDDRFLVCTRERESNGDYAAVSRGGNYYGAYQFAPTTWNVTASHTGRLDLVGVLPSAASQHDQDEMAWSLYGWQGSSPWGGRC